ncbi:MAG: PQQ-binding-like beta-propeller repeat protein [Treponema sp.]|nr:PQQ-binding-like beta-propeller repeat protein [Treponema sp.]
MKNIFLLYLLFISCFAFADNADGREQGLYTGDPYWRQALGGSVLSLPDARLQSAVVALDGGNIRAYFNSGRPLWDFSAKAKISPYVTRSREGTSYFSTTAGVLYAVNRSGREIWRRRINGPLTARVISGWDGRIFVPVNRKILCYTASGTLLWTRSFEAAFSISPELDRDGWIIFALENNEVYHVDPFGNIHKWNLSDKPLAVYTVHRNNSPAIMTAYKDGTIDILGSDEWYISAQNQIKVRNFPGLPAAPLAASGRENFVAFLLDNGETVLVSVDEEKLLWSGDSHIKELLMKNGRADTEAELVFNDRGIYILSKEGATSFSHDGKRLWFTYLKNAASVPAIGDDGILYSGGKDWILYAYKIEDTISQSRSLYAYPVQGSYTNGKIKLYMGELPLGDYEIKTRLDKIGKSINSGMVANNECEWLSFLMTAASDKYAVQFRADALRLLGRLGSRETIGWLSDLFRRENDPGVKAAIASAIGGIGVDPEADAIRAFMDTVFYSNGDEQVFTAIASATASLCRFSGPPLSETGVKILTLLGSYSHLPLTRRTALKELEALR